MNTNQAIIKSMLEFLGADTGLHPLRNELMPLCSQLDFTDLEQWTKLMEFHFGDSNSEFYRSIYYSNRETDLFANVFGQIESVTLVEKPTIERLLESDTGMISYWPNVKSEYPDALGLIEFGWPYLGNCNSKCLIYAGIYRGPKNGAGSIYFLESTEWKVRGKAPIWVS